MIGRILGSVAFLAFVGSAHAMPVVFDFDKPDPIDLATLTGGFADSCGDADICNGGGGELTWSKGGVTITTVSTSLPAGAFYIQDVTPTVGGVGIDGGAGDPGNDNFADPEIIELLITGATKFLGFELNGDHTDLAPGTMDLLVGGTTELDDTALDAAILDIDISAAGTTIKFRPNDDGFTGYVAAMTFERSVPEPGTLTLLGMGVLGIGAAVRRRRLVRS